MFGGPFRAGKRGADAVGALLSTGLDEGIDEKSHERCHGSLEPWQAHGFLFQQDSKLCLYRRGVNGLHTGIVLAMAGHLATVVTFMRGEYEGM